jgi:hypothetical protein
VGQLSHGLGRALVGVMQPLQIIPVALYRGGQLLGRGRALKLVSFHNRQH